MKEKCEYEKLMEEMGYDEETLYIISYSKLDFLANELSKIHNSGISCDPKFFLISTIKKMLDVWQSIHLIYNNNKDMTSLCSLSRMLTDNYAIINLIFNETKDTDEQQLRIFLYLLDAAKTRNKTLEKRQLDFDPRYITKEDVSKIEKQCQDADKSDTNAINNIVNILGQTRYNSIHQSIINNSNWKYKDKTKETSKFDKSNTFSWIELYKKFSSDTMALTYSNYLSQFVHGLGISYMQHNSLSENGSFIIGMNIILMEETNKLLSLYFVNDISRLNIDWKKSDASNYFISMYLDNLRDDLTIPIQA